MKKVVSLITVLAFIVTNSFWGDLLPAYAQTASPQQPIQPKDVSIPSEMASIHELFDSQVPEGSPLIIAIQDAHGIYDAQKNIRAIIQVLQDEYGFDLVALEGASGRADHTLLRSFPDEEIKKEVADKYMKRAELSGGEVAAIINPKRGLFYGVEDERLYFQNRNDFLKAQEYRTHNLHTLNLLESKLDSIRDKIYPEELRQFHKREWDYYRDRITLIEFIEDLESRKSQVAGRTPFSERYPNLTLIFELKEASVKNLSKKEQLEKERELTARVEGKKLFQEIAALSQEIKSNYYETEDIQTLDTIYSRLRVLKGLSRLEMSRSDWDLYQAKKEDFDFIKFVEFLDKFEKSIHLTLKLKPAEQFYKGAVKRDEALYNNLVQAMEQEKQNRAIIVAGGFHTEGLRERLQANQLSYLILSPRIEHVPEENLYLKVMQGIVSYRKQGRYKIQMILKTMRRWKQQGLVNNEEYTAFLKAILGDGLDALAQAVETREDFEDETKTFLSNIIRKAKAIDPVSDPSAMLNFAEELVSEEVKRRAGKGTLERTLTELKETFGTVLKGEVLSTVNRFVEDMQKLISSLETIKVDLKPLHVELVTQAIRENISYEQIENFILSTDGLRSVIPVTRELTLEMAITEGRLEAYIAAVMKQVAAKPPVTGVVEISPFARFETQVEVVAHSLGGEEAHTPRGPPDILSKELERIMTLDNEILTLTPEKLKAMESNERDRLIKKLREAVGEKEPDLIEMILDRTTDEGSSFQAAQEAIVDALFKELEISIGMITPPLAKLTAFANYNGLPDPTAFADRVKRRLRAKNTYFGPRILLINKTPKEVSDFLSEIKKEILAQALREYEEELGREDSDVFRKKLDLLVLKPEMTEEMVERQMKEEFEKQFAAIEYFSSHTTISLKQKPDDLKLHPEVLKQKMMKSAGEFMKWDEPTAGKLEVRRKIIEKLRAKSTKTPEEVHMLGKRENSYFKDYDTFRSQRREKMAKIAGIAAYLSQQKGYKGHRSMAANYIENLLVDAYEKLYERSEFAEKGDKELLKRVHEKIQEEKLTEIVIGDFSMGPVKRELQDEATPEAERQLASFFRNLTEGRFNRIPLFDYHKNFIPRLLHRVENLKEDKRPDVYDLEDLRKVMVEFEKSPAEIVEALQRVYVEYRIATQNALVMAYRNPRLRELYKLYWMEEVKDADEKGLIQKWKDHLRTLDDYAGKWRDEFHEKSPAHELNEYINLLTPGAMFYVRGPGDEIGIYRKKPGFPEAFVAFGEMNGLNAWNKAYLPDERDSLLHRFFLDLVEAEQAYPPDR